MTVDEAIAFYAKHYEQVLDLHLQVGQKVTLRSPGNGTCRFCGLSRPAVTFQKAAHVLPEMMGNKSLFCADECDACNQLFGSTIEDEFGKWSKPLRAMSRVRGKGGFPAIKKGSDGGWRIDSDVTGFKIAQYEGDEIVTLDEVAKTATFNLKREPHTPLNVLKCLVRIGLAILPDVEMQNFQDALGWIREKDPNIGWGVSSLPVFYTFVPGPPPFVEPRVKLFRRLPHATGVPYVFYTVAYGSEMFQVFLPSTTQDQNLSLTMPTFPSPFDGKPHPYGPQGRTVLDLTGRERKEASPYAVTMSYQAISIGPGGPSVPSEDGSLDLR